LATRLGATAIVVAGILGLVTACSQDRDPTEIPGITPPLMRGRPVRVDACDLVPPAQASEIASQRLFVVGMRIQPPRLETVRCDLGQEFGIPLVSIELTTDPIAYAVFDAAYGQAAGGDPQPVRGIERPAILRTEGDQRTIRTFVHGAVISVQTNDDVAPLLARTAMVELSRLALRRLPSNPVLREEFAIDECRSVPDDIVDLVLGRPPVLELELASQGSVQCSWGGQPGAAVVTVSDDPGAVRRFARLARADGHVQVDGVGPADSVRAWSSTEDAGDLIVLSADRVLSIEVTPAAGFSDPDIATTPPELALARAAVRTLG